MKVSSRFMSIFLVLALILSCSACASGTGAYAEKEETGEEAAVVEVATVGEEEAGEELSDGAEGENGLFLSLTEATSKSLSFPLTAELDGVTLASLEHVTIKPYASFHTMWEMFDEIQRLAGEGDDDSATPKPYVEYGVMGKSCLGYDMPYLIVARDSAAVQKWLDLSEKAEETGTAVIEELQNSGDDDYVDARMHYTRNSANGHNLNRDNSFQVMPETQNMQHLIGTYDPVTFLELHGLLEPFQIEPAIPPHQPNFEYDVIARNQMAGGEAFGAAAVLQDAGSPGSSEKSGYAGVKEQR